MTVELEKDDIKTLMGLVSEEMGRVGVSNLGFLWIRRLDDQGV